MEDEEGSNLDGIFFYWFTWIGWAYCSFLMKASRRRTMYSIMLLMMMILQGFTLRAGNLLLHFSFVFLLMCGFVFAFRLDFKRMLSFVFCSCLVALAYNAMLLFSMYDPVWMVVEVKWLLSGVLFLLSLFLMRETSLRPFMLGAGMAVGETVYHFIIKKLTLALELGSLTFFDVLTLSVALCFVWEGLHQFSAYIYAEAGKGRVLKRASR